MYSLIKKLMLLVMVLFWSSSFALAQEMSVEVSVDKPQATLEDEIILQVVIKGSIKASDPVLPSLREFKIISMGTSSSYHNINGNIQTEKSFTYVLIPQKEGTYTIDPVSVFAGGREYKSSSLSIEISASPAFPQTQTLGQNDTEPKEKYWIEVSVSNKEPYVHEQIIYTFKLYTSVNMGRASLTLPEFKGFLVEEVVGDNQLKTTLDGTTYLVNEKILALFPLNSGHAIIDETSLLVEVPDDKLQDIYRDNIFSFKNNRWKTVELKKKAIEIKVLPLPQPVPDNFTNLVGNFNMKVKLDDSEIKFGDSTTLTLKIEGSGNVKDAKLPSPFEIPGFKIYEDKPYVSDKKTKNGMTGFKEFKLALLPTKEGEMEIPPFFLTYFNPQTKNYEELVSPSLALNVLPGTKEALNPVIGGINSPNQKEELPIAQDIATIHTHFNLNDVDDSSVNQKALFIFGFSLPPALFFGIAFLAWMKRKREGNLDYYTKKGALKNYLSLIKKINPQSKEATKKIMEAFQSYMGDKLQLEAKALTPQEMVYLLNQHQVPQTLFAELEQLLSELEINYYGGASHSKLNQWLKKGIPLVKKIDTYL